jgi:hypothetical protein
MQTLTHRDLAGVTGGTTPTTTSTGTGTTNDQLLTAIQGIQSDLSDLGKHQGGLFGNSTNAMLFMTMALAMRQREVVVYARPRWRHW